MVVLRIQFRIQTLLNSVNCVIQCYSVETKVNWKRIGFENIENNSTTEELTSEQCSTPQLILTEFKKKPDLFRPTRNGLKVIEK